MVKKTRTSVRRKTGIAKSRLQFAEVSFGNPDVGSVIIPVSSCVLSKRRRAQIIAKARSFHTKGLFIQECTNPKFVKALAGDFIKDLAPLRLQRYVAGQFAQKAFDCYFNRLEQALATDTTVTLKRTQTFLTVKATKNHLGQENMQYVATFPDDYAENLVSAFSGLVARLFEKPKRNTTANFWLMYTKWIWTNQMAQAMEDLEKKIGTRCLQKMKSERLFAEVLRIYARSGTAGPELARLTEWYLREFADIAVAPLRELPLDEFEVILLLRRKGSSRLVAFADLGAQIDAVLERPNKIYSFPPRRFEELVAFALSK